MGFRKKILIAVAAILFVLLSALFLIHYALLERHVEKEKQMLMTASVKMPGGNIVSGVVPGLRKEMAAVFICGIFAIGFFLLVFDRFILRKLLDQKSAMETELLESERQYRLLFNEMSNGFIFLEAVSEGNGGYRVLVANPAFGKLSGISRKNSEGKLLSELMPGFEKAGEGLFGKVLGTGVPGQLEIYSLEMKKFLELKIFSPAAGMLGILINDISDRKESDRKIAESLHFLQMLIDAIPLPVFYKDSNLVYRFCNREFEKYMGRPRAEIMGKRACDVAPKELAEAYEAKDRQLLKDKGTLIYEYALRYPDGTIHDILFHKALIGDEDAKFAGILGVMLDITDRKRFENSLRESEKKFYAVINQSYQFIGILDLNGNIVEANESALRLSGINKADILNKPFWETPWWAHSKELQAKLKDAVKRASEGEFVRFEATHVALDASVHYVDFSLKPARDETGKLIFLVPEGRDITDRKKAEEILLKTKNEAEQANRELENAIERSNMLALEAQMASIAKSEFLANVSHEIRTPLNGVIGMTELIMESGLNATQNEYATIVLNSAENLLGIINQILDFSKIEAGKLELEEVDFELRELLDKLGDIFVAAADAKKIEFVSLIRNEVPEVIYGDPVRIRQVLLNLIGNAIKFTSKGEVVLEVKVIEEARRGKLLSFSVRDTGIGIPKNRMDRLFKSFSQIDASTTRKYGGTGLGLAIAKRLVEAMGGEINVETGIEKGSRFWFVIPLKISSELPGASSLYAKSGLRHVKVLGVDDNPVNLKVLREYLNYLGSSYQDASDAREALTKLEEAASAGSPFNIVILDMAMPEMDGVELAARIRDNPRLKDTLLIMLSSHVYNDYKELIRKGLINAFLFKPVKRAQLFQKLSEALAGKSVCDEPPEIAEDKAGPGLTALDEKDIASLSETKTDASGERNSEINILLVEDNPINQKLAVKILEKQGYKVDIASNGLEAVRKSSEKNFDIILMDVEMPEMDGLEAVAAIRRRERESSGLHVPVVAMTAHAMQSDRQKCFNAGMDDYISKPIRKEELIKILRKNLSSSGTACS